MKISTVCYLENNHAFLMMLRNRKRNDVNKGKWIGIGGKLIPGESPEECAYREIEEESAIVPEKLQARGILTFCYAAKEPEYIFVYTGTTKTREFAQCDEGDLAWIEKTNILDLPLWEGDRVFLKYLLDTKETSLNPFFSLKLIYDEEDRLLESKLYLNE